MVLLDSGDQPTSTSPTELDPQFCSEVAVFKVENTIFRVLQREIAAASPVFTTMFALPEGDGHQVVEGKTDEHPIILEGHKSADFRALLRVLYPTTRDMLQGGVTLNKDQWIGVLKLSTIWEMQEIREHAIAELSKESTTALTAVEKVTLGRNHRIVSWLVEGLMELTWNDRELSPDALEEAVGLRTAFRICTARLRQSEQHARISPLSKAAGHYTGLRIADLHYTCCWKPFVPDDRVKPRFLLKRSSGQ